jgi:hypothetical protein
MSNFQKLSRAEMKKVKGGVEQPPGKCESTCGGALGQCGSTQECKTTDCRDKDGNVVSISVCMNGGA